MIRFCDSEVGCVEYELLDRSKLLSYFWAGHLDEIVCVYDSSGMFMGSITYRVLLYSISVEAAINREYVILDDDIWRNARDIFKKKSRNVRDLVLLPVLDKNYQLVCFAYQDEDANREIRMLRELCETEGALQFADVFPQYKCVKIHDFNELAYYFVDYLKNQNIPVLLDGVMWQEFFSDEECEVPEYECLNIYAEGTWAKSRNWKENLQRSVSVEFESVDKIYEANILAGEGSFQDAAGDCSWLMQRIKSGKEIVIIGTGIESVNAYDILLSEGIDIFCFQSESNKGWKNKLLFGKKVLSEQDIKDTVENPVFIECYNKNSAWGFGEVDRYDYEGYKRNQDFFLLRDYTNIYIGALSNILKRKNVTLVGNLNLCYSIGRILEEVQECSVSYWDILEENVDKGIQMTQKTGKDIKEDDICCLIEPRYFCDGEDVDVRKQLAEKRQLYLQKLNENNINITEYFSSKEVLFAIQKKNVDKYTLPCITPGKILLNISGHMSGNAFFSFILDGHPDIMIIDDDTVLCNNLFLICLQLAEEQAGNIQNAFWKIYDLLCHKYKGMILQNKEKFAGIFDELLSYKNLFTPQELFVMFHIAYAKMRGMTISSVHNMLIYYEDRPQMSHDKRINYEEWLCDEKVKGYSIRIARNAYARMGSYFKFLEKSEKFVYPGINSLWRYMTYENESPGLAAYWRRIDVKFETLKIFPKETLIRLCSELELPWDDCLLETTFQGNIAGYPSGNDIITGFDLKPVYNLYEEYFSDFDRFRINLIFCGIQSKFDYPYTSCRNFSGRQLQEMLLHEFRFENKISYVNDDGKERFHKDFVRMAAIYLQKARREEICVYM